MKKQPIAITIMIALIVVLVLASCGKKDEKVDFKDTPDPYVSEQPTKSLKTFVLGGIVNIPLPEGFVADEMYYRDIEEEEPASITFTNKTDPDMYIDVLLDDSNQNDNVEFLSLKKTATENLSTEKEKTSIVQTEIGPFYTNYNVSDDVTMKLDDEDVDDSIGTPGVLAGAELGDYYLTLNMYRMHYDEETTDTKYMKLQEENFKFLTEYIQTITLAKNTK